MERRRRAWSKHGLMITCFMVLVAWRIVDAQERTLETDRAALERFKQGVDPSGNLLTWQSGTNPCAWTGVQCSLNRVTDVRLSGFNFEGVIPVNTIGDLDQLRILSLHHNRFTGTFPVDLGRCTNLRGLFLGSNFFTGPLPDFSRLWPGLSHLDTAFNNFSGEIPVSINALSNLLVLELQNNAFSGKFPPFGLNLLRFSVANNKLEGAIPLALQSFPNSSFDGNVALCGPPTTKLCSPASPSPMSLSNPGGSATARASEMSVGAIAGVAAGAFVVTFAFIVFVLCCCCPHRGGNDELEDAHVGKRVSHYNGEHGGEQSAVDNRFRDVSILPSPHGDKRELHFLDQGKRYSFGLEDLLQASAETLGKGSMGTSYKADMADCVVVVKRLKYVAAERKEFETHVERLGRLRHRHLLPLRAFYFSRDEKLIVTDFTPRGSLFSLLHGERRGNRPVLNWANREKIAVGTARALAYLHKPCVKMAHGNIKSSNILLNRDYEPLLSDYCLTSLMNPAASQVVGYYATEVTDVRQVSMQSDVYSFGVLLLELITGNVPSNADESDTGVDLPRWLMTIPREDWSVDAVDPVLLQRTSNDSSNNNDYAEEEMAQMLHLAVACVDRVPERRPKMDELVLLLEDIAHLETIIESPFRRPSADMDALAFRPRSASLGPTPLCTRPSSGVFVVE